MYDLIHKIVDNKKQRKLKPLPAEFHFEQSVELEIIYHFSSVSFRDTEAILYRYNTTDVYK